MVAEHALRLGAFDATRSAWEGGAVRIGELHWRLHAGDAPLRVEHGELITELALQPGDRPLVLIVTADPTFDVRTDDVLARVADRSGGRQHLVVRGARPYAPTVDRRLADGLDVLRACTHAPTGALLAAPTTSLPEVPGADRQWDYRYTWLRDGSLGAAVAAVAGDSEVADGYLGFLERLGPEKVLQSPLWSVDASPVPLEREIAEVEGWGRSQPVRVGNAASTQVQYDALGFLVEAISIVSRETGELTPGRWALVHAVAEQVTARPPGRTAGIWELREPRHLVAADIGVWMALDHALRLAERHRLPALPSWSTAREAARRRVRGAVLPDGLLPQSYPGTDGPPRPDASALVAVICGLIEPDDPAAERDHRPLRGGAGHRPLPAPLPAWRRRRLLRVGGHLHPRLVLGGRRPRIGGAPRRGRGPLHRSRRRACRGCCPRSGTPSPVARWATPRWCGRTSSRSAPSTPSTAPSSAEPRGERPPGAATSAAAGTRPRSCPQPRSRGEPRRCR